jgi:maltose/moltooligosaccharide transporter
MINMSEVKVPEKFDAKKTILIGLAFFTAEIAWSLYNTQVSIKLNGYFALLGIVGFWMALDNIIGVVIQPIMGNVSDNTRTKLGRRMPYLIIGVPLGALFFALIPTDALFPPETGVFVLLLWIFLFGLAMGFYRSQAVALMPDFIPPQHRSKGNAIINIWSGIGGIFAFTLSLLSDFIGLQLTFIIVSIIMVIAIVILVLTVKEKDAYGYQLILALEEKEGKKVKDKTDKPGLIASVKDIWAEEDKSTLFMLLAIFFWFIAYQGLAALLSIYGVNILNLSPGFAGFMFNFVALPFIICAFPFAIIATKIGRRKAIKIGLILMISALFLGFILVLVSPNWIYLAICFVIAGMGWAFVNVNSIVIIWEMAPSAEKIGTYTGVYYFFSFNAAIFGPAIVGALTDLTGQTFLLINAAIFLIIALILMFFVKRGEVELTEEEKLERQKAIQEL